MIPTARTISEEISQLKLRIADLEGLKIDYSSEWPTIQSLPITEVREKSLRERVNRHTRVKKVVSQPRNPEPVVRKEGDTDPRGTAKGRQSLRGSRLRASTKYKENHPDQYTESVEFIKSTYGKSVDIVLEVASKLRNPINTLIILDKLIEETKGNSEWLITTKEAILTLLEGRPYRTEPLIAKLGDIDNELVIYESAKLLAKPVVKYIKRVWVERIEDNKCGIVQYSVVGDSPDEYNKALDKGIVRSIA